MPVALSEILQQCHSSEECIDTFFAGCVADLAELCLIEEVNTWPKPGLVSHIDNGSHTDMDAQTFYRSATAIKPFFEQMVQAGWQNASMQTLRKIGLQAECEMLAATGGINTHRGAIFGLGLLCASAGLYASKMSSHFADISLGTLVSSRWGKEILPSRNKVDDCLTHGEKVCRQYGVGGAQLEAFDGFPSVYEVGLPALRLGYALAPNNVQAARVQTCFALIAKVEDTNLLHRGGMQGLRFAQAKAQEFLDQGGIGQKNWQVYAQAIHHEFIERNLSPGGCADLLGMCIFVDRLSRLRSA